MTSTQSPSIELSEVHSALISAGYYVCDRGGQFDYIDLLAPRYYDDEEETGYGIYTIDHDHRPGSVVFEGNKKTLSFKRTGYRMPGDIDRGRWLAPDGRRPNKSGLSSVQELMDWLAMHDDDKIKKRQGLAAEIAIYEAGAAKLKR